MIYYKYNAPTEGIMWHMYIAVAGGMIWYMHDPSAMRVRTSIMPLSESTSDKYNASYCETSTMSLLQDKDKASYCEASILPLFVSTSDKCNASNCVISTMPHTARHGQTDNVSYCQTRILPFTVRQVCCLF